MNIKQQRADLLAAAQTVLDNAEGRDFTPAEIKSLESKRDAIKALDVRIAASDEGQRLRDAIGGVGPNERHGDGSAPKGGRLNFRGLGDRMAEAMQSYSGRMAPGSKGLVPTGESVLDVPLVNTEPTPSALGQERALRLIDLLPVTVRTAPVYSFLRQAVIASPGAAGVVAPGAVKPTKKLGVERVDARLRVLAVLSEPQDKYLLSDAANLRTWVGIELADAIQEALELEVLSGDGTGEHFVGLANTSGIQTQAMAADTVTTLAAGLSKLTNAGIAPSFIALSADDALALQTTRNASGAFDLGGAIDPAASTAWGTPFVVVPGLVEGDGYIVGQDAVTLSTDNAGVRVEWGTPGDAFTRNQLVARVEGRFGLDVTRPHGVVRLNLAA